MASSPGHAGHPNEDFVGAGPGLAVMLDGAGIPGTDAICRHGVAWYSHTLGATLLSGVARQGGTDLVGALADSIEEVAGRHRHTCDLANPSSPQSTVAMVRFEEDTAHYLVLADAFVVLDQSEDGPNVLTDSREVSVRSECTSLLRDVPRGTPKYDQVRDRVIDALRARRNTAGGYWIAKDDAAAASEAVTGTVSVSSLRGAALFTNGASRVVDPYGLSEWPSVLELLRTGRPDELLRRLREAEAAAGPARPLPGFVAPDDATVAYCDPTR